ncbi:15890_t:CDS:2 [Funneliformis caledonium]|uniref:15890_t:CDS:1 n=1 Tax=Funneliformis caledonium TaxID=1117310 RepID=A0A9N9AV36_9GLOM|nr:15890_t:CDS:2 [Funneliformis caledonium]
MCLANGIRDFSISQALNVVLKDDLDSKLNPVRLFVNDVRASKSCSGGDIFYVPTLAGIIQGPLASMFRESSYLYLPLPLRLLRDQEVWSISEFVARSERNHNLGDYINKEDVDHNFVLPDADSIKYHELKYRYLYTVQQEYLSFGTVYKNGLNAPWDIFFFLNNCLFAIQVKSSNPEANQPQTLDKSMIDGEQKPDLKTNDKMDVNTAEGYELRTIKGIGPATAREILSKRPYDDEDDLYNQVNIDGQAKKKIKVIKKY